MWFILSFFSLFKSSEEERESESQIITDKDLKEMGSIYGKNMNTDVFKSSEEERELRSICEMEEGKSK